MTYNFGQSKDLFLWIHWFYMISLFWLFNHFYQHNYNKKMQTESDLKKCKSN